jgi:hypothetical protein
VLIAGSSTATVLGNSIHSNTGGGIINQSGAPAPPVLNVAVAGHVAGLACANCNVDLYEDAGSQGKNYLASGTADALGNFSFNGVPHTLTNFTGLARNGGNTSAFSAPLAGPLNFDGDGLPDANDSCPAAGEDSDGHQDNDGCPDPDNDGDGLCDAGQTSVSCTGSDTGAQVFDPAGTLPAPTLDCRNQPEDLDAFKDGDGCPEPDNDNDGFPDVTDDCPGTDSRAGADGMLGSPQDLNHNGIRDGAEAVLTTDDVMPALVWEDSDGVLDTDGCHDSPGDDFDGDGLTDNSEVFTHLTNAAIPDTDADGVIDGPDNCRLWPNPAQALPPNYLPLVGSGPDSDCDRFTNSRETYLTTDATKHCAASTTANNEPPPDLWPLDMNDDRRANTVDVGAYVGKIGLDNTEVGWTARLDLNQSANGIINTADVGFYVGRLGNVCSPTGP